MTRAADVRPEPARSGSLADVIAAEERGLLTCVHCGFCLPACPTYVRLGDENDSPRGRLHLMRAVVDGRLDAASEAFQTHIDRCLGCRACEPVCPSGVPYGRLLELARCEAVAARPGPRAARLLLTLFASPRATRIAMWGARVLRSTGLVRLALRVLPRALVRVRMGLAMLEATAPVRWEAMVPHEPGADAGGAGSAGPASDPTGPEGTDAVRAGSGGTDPGPVVAGLLEGCVQAGLLAPVNAATLRVLEANAVETVPVPGQACCGALHAHGGDLETARKMARRNVDAFEAAGVELVVVNAAGCGAIMKEYGHLLAGDPAWADRARRLAARVRDISEVLADRGPRVGGTLPVRVTLDAPCHLLHAQGVADAPGRVLAAVPGLELVELEGGAECCGGAGIYGVTHPGLGGRIGEDKVAAVRRTGAAVCATGNPGCIMQIGAGLRLAGARVAVVHPVELLDTSYRRAGWYPSTPTSAAREREGA